MDKTEKSEAEILRDDIATYLSTAAGTFDEAADAEALLHRAIPKIQMNPKLFLFSCAYLRLSGTGYRDFRRCLIVAKDAESVRDQLDLLYPDTIQEHWKLIQISTDLPAHYPVDN